MTRASARAQRDRVCPGRSSCELDLVDSVLAFGCVRSSTSKPDKSFRRRDAAEWHHQHQRRALG